MYRDQGRHWTLKVQCQKDVLRIIILMRLRIKDSENQEMESILLQWLLESRFETSLSPTGHIWGSRMSLQPMQPRAGDVWEGLVPAFPFDSFRFYLLSFIRMRAARMHANTFLTLTIKLIF